MDWSTAVAEIRSGNECGVEELYAAVSDCARGQLFHSVDPQAVDDHVQEILMIVQGAIRSGELRDPLCLMGFVRTVTRRQVAVHIRGRVLGRRRLVSVEVTTAPAAPPHESPEARLAHSERIAIVGNILALLCPRDREILRRFYYDEQESDQICREMELTATQFRLYKSRALAKCGDLSNRGRQLRQSTRPLRIA